MVPLAVFVSLLLLYSLVSRRLESTIVTAPIVFTVAGMLMFPSLQGILRPGENSAIFLGIAEVGLVMLLFTDASRTDLNVLRSIRNLPAMPRKIAEFSPGLRIPCKRGNISMPATVNTIGAVTIVLSSRRDTRL